jgi:translation initiation factor 2B subunit (eIF-2B alpha/beta/delta family)
MENLQVRIADVRDDRDHGSRWLVRETIAILRDLTSQRDPAISEEEQVRRLREAGHELAMARPAMAALSGAVRHVLGAPGGLDGMAREAERLQTGYEQATVRITEHARPLLSGTLLTHSLSGTVLEVLLACKEQLTEVIVLEGRPRYEGREVAHALAAQGLAITLITDAQADIFLPQCSAVVIGADTVLADGSVLNKAGSALLARACQGHGLPFYVLCETLKISPERWNGDLARLEEKEPEEVLPQPIPGVRARNFYFDRTPGELVTALISERGRMGREEIAAYTESLPPLP